MVALNGSTPPKNGTISNWMKTAFTAVAFCSFVALPLVGIKLYRDFQIVGMPAKFAPSGVEEAVNCVDAIHAYAQQATIYFSLNSSTISPEGRAAILEISDQLLTCPEARVYVYGHADNTGGDNINDRMSWRRAEAVLDVLAIEKRDTTRFRLHGQSAKELVEMGDSDEESSLDRRVEFEVHKIR
ncbi:MAG: OmpA family protein [Sulfitobacter sp.]